MKKASFVLFCLACKSNGREVPTSIHMGSHLKSYLAEASESTEPLSALAIILLASNPASAFSRSHGKVQPSVHTNRGTPPQMGADEQVFSRRAMVAGTVGLGFGAIADPALAGYVTSLGIEDINVKDVEKDDEILSSREVQKSINNIRGYKQAASSLAQQFSKNTNMELIRPIRKALPFDALRDDFNLAETVFDEDTQKTIDKKLRVVLYSVTELESAARMKKGVETRTPKKIESINGWFRKLDADFAELIKYFPSQLPPQKVEKKDEELPPQKDEGSQTS